MNESIFCGYGVEITLAQPDDFLKVKETLTRIGIASEHKKQLFQSCHILHKRGRYSIMHFKELFALDGKPASIDEQDIARRNSIVTLLANWGLLTIIDPTVATNQAPLRQIKVLPFKEKADWELIAKYTVGTRK